MEFYILFIQRKESYTGQYGLEAIEIMDEYSYADNPDYLNNKLKEQQKSNDILKAEIITIEINEKELVERMFPSNNLKGKIKTEE